MGLFVTDALEAPLTRRRTLRHCLVGENIPARHRNVRRTFVRAQNPLRGPIRKAISGYRFYNPELGRWVNRDPIEERGGIHLYAFVSGDPINQVDPIGLQAKDNATDNRECRCCCAEDIDVWASSGLIDNGKKWSDVMHFAVTQELKVSDEPIDRPECSFTWLERSNIPIRYVPGDGNWHDISSLANRIVKVNWGPMKEGYPIEDAFVDYAWTLISGIIGQGLKIHVHGIELTVYSSTDPKCRDICQKKGVRIFVSRKVNALRPDDSTIEVGGPGNLPYPPLPLLQPFESF